MAQEADGDLGISDRRVLGQMYFMGRGVEQDYEKAAELLADAAGDNDRDAMYAVAVCYFSGYGVEQDEEKAMELLTGAAEQGLPIAMARLEELTAEDPAAGD